MGRRDGRILAAAGLLAAVLTAACGSAGRPTEARQTGVLDGMPFTVAAGTVQQSGPGRPVTVGRAGALLIFDQPLGSLAPRHRNLRVTATATFDDGGQVVLGAFGDAGTMAGAYGIGARRQGDTFHYRFQYGLRRGPGAPAQEQGAFASTPRDPDATLYFRTEFHTTPALELLAWTPWNSIPADCTAGPVRDAGPAPDESGEGRRLGVWLRSVTLHGVSLLWATYQGCAQGDGAG
jgi:hypothetical protein